MTDGPDFDRVALVVSQNGNKEECMPEARSAMVGHDHPVVMMLKQFPDDNVAQVIGFLLHNGIRSAYGRPSVFLPHSPKAVYLHAVTQEQSLEALGGHASAASILPKAQILSRSDRTYRLFTYIEGMTGFWFTLEAFHELYVLMREADEGFWDGDFRLFQPAIKYEEPEEIPMNPERRRDLDGHAIIFGLLNARSRGGLVRFMKRRKRLDDEEAIGACIHDLVRMEWFRKIFFAPENMLEVFARQRVLTHAIRRMVYAPEVLADRYPERQLRLVSA